MYGILERSHRQRVAAFLAKSPKALQDDEKHAIEDLAYTLLHHGQYHTTLLDSRSVDTLGEAFELFMKTGNDEMAARTGFQLGHAYSEIPAIRSIDKAESWYKRLLEHFQGHHPLWEARALHEMGQVNYVRFREALRAGTDVDEVNSLLNVALGYANQALRLIPSEAKADITLVHHLLGNIYDDAGYPDKALPHYNEAISIHDQQEDRVNSAKTRREVARVLLKMRRFDDALLYAKAALRKLEPLGTGASKDIQITQQLIDGIIRYKGEVDA